MRSKRVHKQSSPTCSIIVTKFPKVIIINYQRLSDKHVLKNKSKTGKTTFKVLTTRIQKNIIFEFSITLRHHKVRITLFHLAPSR